MGVSLGAGCDVTGGATGGVSGECAVSRQCDSGGVAPVTGESKRGVDAGDSEVISPGAGGGTGDDEGIGARGPGAVESDPVAGITAVSVASAVTGSESHDLCRLGAGSVPGVGLSPAGAGLGRAWSVRIAEAGAAERHAGRGVDRGSESAVGDGDGPEDERSRGQWVRLADVGGTGVSGAQKRGLAMATEPADGPGAGGAPLAGVGVGHLLGDGLWGSVLILLFMDLNSNTELITIHK